jgi:hypothetical protein
LIDFDFKMDKRSIRLFAGTVPAVLILWGTIIGFRNHWGGVAFIWLYSIAVVLFFWGMISPFTLKPIYRGWMVFTRCVSWLLTNVVLGVVFYLGFTATGLVMRLLGKDPLHRRMDKGARSYWVKRDSASGNSSDYERQF